MNIIGKNFRNCEDQTHNQVYQLGKLSIISKRSRKVSNHPKTRCVTLPHLYKPIAFSNHQPFGQKILHSDMVFSVEGDYPDVIQYLKQKGWRKAEKNSKFLFLWSKNAKISKKIKDYQIINHVSNINELSTKVKLCENLSNTSSDFFPECYVITNHLSDEFITAFRKNYTESLLKNIQKSAKTDSELINLIFNSKYDEMIHAYLGEKKIMNKQDLESLLRNLEKSDCHYCIKGDQNI